MRASRQRLLCSLSILFGWVGFCLDAGAQTTPANQWTWIDGSQTVGNNCPNSFCGRAGVYGALGVPSASNAPGSRSDAIAWSGSNGNLWLFGGAGFDAAGNDYLLNDLWEFNTSTLEWAWMGGSSAINQNGIYGTLGASATGNIPGSRRDSASWTDSNGNLWLFGGWGFDASGGYGALGDLWKFSSATNQWAWMGGSDQFNQSSVYGKSGTPAAGNTPGARYFSMDWTDGNGKFWLFGGYGFDSNNAFGEPDDLWEFDPSSNQWAWMGGSNTLGAICPTAYCASAGVYGALRTPAAGNMPGSRSLAVTWTDRTGNLWLFSGVGFDSRSSFNNLNDLWEFNPSSKQWAWMGGSSTGGQPGVYGVQATASPSNIPGSRNSASTWTDSKGHIWVFGGQSADSAGTTGELNDLWEFDTSANQWVWMGGANLAGNNSSLGHVGPPGVYGVLGTAAAANVPGGRASALNWIDRSDRLWLFGGDGFDSGGAWGYLNDLWMFEPPVTVSDFSIVAAPATLTVTAGQSGTLTVSITPANGFNSATTFSCSGLPAGVTCTFSPTSVTPFGSAASAKLTVATTASAAALHRDPGPLSTGAALAAILCWIGWKKRRRLPILILIAAGAFCLTALTACGGGGSGSTAPPPHQPTTSTITATAASGSLQHSTTISLTID